MISCERLNEAASIIQTDPDETVELSTYVDVNVVRNYFRLKNVPVRIEPKPAVGGCEKKCVFLVRKDAT